METRTIDGKRIATEIRAEVAEEISDLKKKGIIPGLATVLVGDDPASKVYVGSKNRVCQELGMHSERIALPAETSSEDLLEVIRRLNTDPEIDGILVQLPLPPQIDERTILASVHPEKDVDGFHPLNAGLLLEGRAQLAPCTPMGIMELLRRENVPVQGAEAVVVGRSNIVGKPTALLLLHRHATITVCHSRTRDLADVCRRADILVAAVGKPALIRKNFIKEGAVVIDVGTNRIETREEIAHLFGENSERLESFEKRGSTLVGDVHPREVQGIASAVTPVPGGVGPLTIAHLMKNTVIACKLRRNLLETEA